MGVKSTLDNDTINLLNSFCQNIYCTGNGSIYVDFNDYFLTYDKNLYNLGASYPAEWKYFDIYVDQSYTGLSDGTSDKPFKNLIEAIAYSSTLKNLNINIVCNEEYESDEKLYIVNNNQLKITNVSINSLYCNKSNLVLENVTFTNNTTGENSLYALNSKLTLNNIEISETKTSDNVFNARGITLVSCEVDINNLKIQNHSLGIIINHNSKVFINNYICNLCSYALAVDENSILMIKTLTGSFTNREYKYDTTYDYVSHNNEYFPLTGAVNLNNIEAYNWYMPLKYFCSNTSITNLPEEAYGWLTCYFQSANTQVQTFLSNSGKFFTRRKTGGTWQAWAEK